ncbi:MAG: YceD family protein [Gammaproteobacteria bacterium]|nr:YceD family protein [Gammaproteobacteria bacterium]
MSAVLPAAIDPIRLADEGSSLEGELPVRTMPRLREACRNPAAMVRVDLHFSRGTYGPVMDGTVTARLELTCQRCLGPVEQDVTAATHVVLLRTGASRSALPEDADFMEVAASVPLAELVEDELLLALPMTPRHPQGACSAPGTGHPDSTQADSGPFSALADLKAGSEISGS